MDLAWPFVVRRPSSWYGVQQGPARRCRTHTAGRIVTSEMSHWQETLTGNQF